MRRRASGWLLAGALLAPVAATAVPIELQVEYRTADRVYVDGGSRLGLTPGTRLEVVRDGEVTSLLEVAFVASHSASCRVLESTVEPRPGDRIVWESPKAVEPQLATSPRAAAVESVRAQAPTYTREPQERRLRTDFSGSLSVDFEQFTDDSGFERDYDRTAARVSLRGRNLGGVPLNLRIRSSTRSLDRIVTSGGSSVTESRDRLYELSLAYEPPEGRFALRLGRLRLGRYAGAGTLDGLSLETRLGQAFHLGLFGGSRSDLSDFGVDSDRTSYGVTARWTSPTFGSRREIQLSGVREDGAIDVSREYVALQVRLGGSGRVTFYQRAELDLNNGWREAASGSTSQLSTLFANLVGRISDRNRVSLSSSRFERYRTEETRFIPEELFDENRRQGLRLRWTIGRPSGFNVSLSGGVREKDGTDEDTTSGGIGVAHNNIAGRKWSLGLNVLTFSNQFSDGTTARLSAGKRFAGGHRLRLTVGSRLLDEGQGGDDRETTWVRLGGWFELPGNLYGRVELESTTGEVLEGQRVMVGFGYRL